MTYNAQSTGYTPPTGGYNQCSTSYSAGGLNTAQTNGSNPFAAMCSQYANAASNGHQQKRITLDLNCGQLICISSARLKIFMLFLTTSDEMMVFSQTTRKYSDETNFLQYNFNYARNITKYENVSKVQDVSNFILIFFSNFPTNPFSISEFREDERT